MRKLTWLMLVFVLLAVNCRKKTKSTGEAKIATEPIPVKVIEVKEETIARIIKITGEIAPLYQVEVYPKANGIVVSELVSLGAKVQRDQMLAEVKQDIPGMKFSNVKIVATNAGYITRDIVEIGTRVSVQTPVYTISGLQPLYMNARVSEFYLSKIKIGEEISVFVDAYPDKEYRGKVDKISPVLDRLTRMADVKIKLKNTDLLLKPGMFARAYLKIGYHKALVIPLDAILRTGTSRHVFRIVDGKANQVAVETGIMLNDIVEVSGRLNAGDRVVIRGQNLLEDGAPVRIVEGK